MSNRCNQQRALHDPEALGDRAPAHPHATVEDLWVRLYACTLQIADEVQRSLRARFGVSLARFDLMAQLRRRPAGIHMKSLARRLMVTGSNVTDLTNELERAGLVSREISPSDRRVRIVRLTPQGRRAFDHMAREHWQWMRELFSGIEPEAIDQLHDGLGTLRVQLRGSANFNEEDPSWNIRTTASIPPCSLATAVRRRTTGRRTSAGKLPIVSRP